MMGILENYESAHDAFQSGRVLNDSNEVLIQHLHGLSNQNNINEGTQHRDIIRGLTINHILLQRHIDSLNKQNSRMQGLVVILALITLLAAMPQIWFAYNADKRAEIDSKTNSDQHISQKSSAK